MGCASSLAIAEKRRLIVLKKEKKRLVLNSLNESEKPIPEEEKKIIKRHWRVLSTDIQRLGATVFLQIFKEHPEVKQLFSFRNVDDDNLLSCAEFRGHAYRFMQAIGGVVENIDNLEKTMSGALIFLGKQHVMFSGIKPAYFDDFYHAISNVWKDVLGKNYTPESANAWKHVFLYTLETLKKGFYQALNDNIAANK